MGVDTKAKILLVDDTVANLTALEAILTSPDTTLVEATSGAAALELLREHEFAVILLDVMMPEMDGFEFARRARAYKGSRDTPIIFLTALASESVAKGYAHGAADYLTKPLDPDEVKAKVAVFVKLHLQNRRLREVEQQLRTLNAESERRAEARAKELAASNERFRLFVDAVHDYGIIQLDDDGRFVAWNAGAERLLGYRDEEIIGRDFSTIFTTEDVAAGIPTRELQTARTKGRANDTRWHQRKDGSRFWAHGSTTALLDETGSPIGFAKVLRDYTASKKVEDALRTSEERLTLAMEAAKLGTWDWNPGVSEVLWDKRCREIFGVTSDAPITFDDFLGALEPRDAKKVLEAVEALQATKKDSSIELEYLATGIEDGVKRWVRATCRASHVSNGPSRLVGTVTDISQQKAVEGEIRKAKEDAEAANRSKSQFLANMSHEIRTPLNSIVGFAELLDQDSVAAPDRQEFRAAIRRNSRLLTQIIDDILDLSKVEAGKLAIEAVECSLPLLLADVKTLLGHQAKEKGIRLAVRSDGPIPEIITADPVRLKQILFNIVGNGVKFTTHGGVDVVVRHLLSPERSSLEFLVKDTGHGISPAQAERLFQPFAQADATTTRVFGGTGLGLVLSRRLAQAMGGGVELCESELGHGSTFKVIVDAGATAGTAFVGAPAATRHDAPPSSHPHEQLLGLRILVAEDSPDSRLLIDRILKRSGARVELASDGHDAVRMALASSPDLILMDLQMPRLDGLEAMSELRRRGFTKPIIALTAHAMKEEREKSLNAGFTDHLSKPLNVGDLLSKIAAFTTSAH